MEGGVVVPRLSRQGELRQVQLQSQRLPHLVPGPGPLRPQEDGHVDHVVVVTRHVAVGEALHHVLPVGDAVLVQAEDPPLRVLGIKPEL